MIEETFVITSNCTFGVYQIYVNDILHLSFNIYDFVGFQSWVDAEKGMFCIEFSFQGNTHILTEYNLYDKWKAILEELRHFTFPVKIK